jgi:hypothetical protein
VAVGAGWRRGLAGVEGRPVQVRAMMLGAEEATVAWNEETKLSHEVNCVAQGREK